MDRAMLMRWRQVDLGYGRHSLGGRWAATALSRVSAVRPGVVANGVARTSGRGAREKLAACYRFLLSGPLEARSLAEDVGDLVEPNFVVDETETVAPEPDSSARFTLGCPPDGWAEGKYRLEFYVNDELEETLRVTIVK